MSFNTKKRWFADALTFVGAPPALAILGFYSEPGNWLWAIPIFLLTFPLLPIYMVGERIHNELDERDFKERTKDLSIVEWSDELIETSISDGEGDKITVSINSFEEIEEFDTKYEAELYLKALGYVEVKIKDNYTQTYWIKSKAHLKDSFSNEN